MLSRCRNPNNEHYHNYGGRGIKVCAYYESFESFFADLGDRPEGKELGRLDDNKDYEPGNVKWMTHRQNINLKK